MSFQVHPVRQVLVRPELPAALSRLSEIAYNLLWSWDHQVRAVFRRLDPSLWKQSNHNPVVLLGRMSQGAFEKAASDPRYLAIYKRACERYDHYVSKQEKYPGQLIAYFSMEYGLLDCMPIYSGGLGVLSGDHLKSSSDSGIPLIGVGLLYQRGYLQQRLTPDGWQQEANPVNDFYNLPVRPAQKDGRDVIVHVDLPSGRVFVKVWYIDVGRVKLYLLDTNIQENENNELHRDITDLLYGGDSGTRIRQEIVLGIGGLRALRVLGHDPSVFHMNEGHSAFLAIERMRVLIQERSIGFEEALEAIRGNNVFTTHTSVPAGIDLFDLGLIYEYFGGYCRDAGIDFERFLGLGRKQPFTAQDRFSMAVLAINTSCYRNAVSVLHRHVSQDMWQDLWPSLPTWEIPITSITNGVHLPTWVNGDLAAIYDQYLEPDWRERNSEPDIWKQVDEIPASEIWEAHRRRKRRLVQFVRDRAVASATDRQATQGEIRRLQELFDPEVFTIGFARRFATYKRATLIFRELDRLKKLLRNPKYPVQIIVAGKAHPKDTPGKGLIREIANFARDPDLAANVIFVEDYGIQVARELVQSVDIWLNTPRRGEEACGTSGMKASLNGVPNLSVLDGWFDEAFEQSGGWAIGAREPYSEDQEQRHAQTIYTTLEQEILPIYYDHRENGTPVEWMRRVKQALQFVSSNFNCSRMVEEYYDQLYAPAHRNWQSLSGNGFAKVRERARWTRQVEQAWGQVRFLDYGPDPGKGVLSGTAIPIEVAIELAGLRPEDVRVEAVVGSVSPDGTLENTHVLHLPVVRQEGSASIFAREFLPAQTGRLGYAVRVCPNHYDDPLTRHCYSLLKWG